MKRLLVTGSCGLIGSEVSRYFLEKGWEVHGIDNNTRAIFFGEEASTKHMKGSLGLYSKYKHYDVSITDRHELSILMIEVCPDAVVHTAAQPSHDLAAKIPYLDFDTNAVGTLNMLEETRHHDKSIPFIHLSTSKVYGDSPNRYELYESKTRYDFVHGNGIKENQTIDQSLHSLFGASKLAADILVQEYGRYFGMPTVCLRPGCLTGPNHSAVQLHGFLNYLVKCNVDQVEYTIFGYKGKQVRDNIHAIDIARFIDMFIENPRVAEVYNIGGGRGNSCSILEAIELVEAVTGRPMKYRYEPKERIGDHICYYGDLSKTRNHYPEWDLTKSLLDIIKEIYERYDNRSPK